MADLPVYIKLLAQDLASKTIRNVNKSLGSLNKQSNAVSRGMSNLGRNLERGLVIGAGAAAAGITFAVAKAIDWESAMAGVNKTLDVTPDQLKAIESGLIAISNKTGVAATDLAAIAEAAGAMGIGKDSIISFTEVVAMLGETTNVSTDEAATALGQLSNVLKLTGDDYDNFAATLVDLGNKGASTEAQILEIARRSGSAASLFGLAKDQTLGWASAAANLGMNEELAGTALQSMLLKSLPEFTNASENMIRITGMSGKALKQAYEKDAGGAMEMLIRKIGELPKAQRQAAAAEIFGKTSGLTRLILGLADSYDKNLAPALDTATEAWEDNTAATEEFAKRQGTTQSQLNRLKQNVTNAAVTIGTKLLPLVNELAAEATGWISTHQDDIEQFGKSLASGLREAVKWAQSLNWPAIEAGLKAAAGFARGLITAFTSMPPQVQAMLIGLGGLNKLSGGMVTDIVGGIGKGIASEIGRSLFQRGGTPANPMFVADVAGGGGGPLAGFKPSPAWMAGLAASAAALVGSLVVVQKGIIEPGLQQQAGANISGTEAMIARGNPQELTNAINGLRAMPDKLNPLQRVLYDLNANGVKTHTEGLIEAMEAALKKGPAGPPQQLGPPSPAYAGVLERATKAGLTPTMEQVKRTGEKNAAHLADLKRATASGDDRIASRIGSMDATLRAKNFSPTVNVSTGFTITTNVSVRDTVTAITKREAYNRVKGGAVKVPL